MASSASTFCVKLSQLKTNFGYSGGYFLNNSKAPQYQYQTPYIDKIHHGI